MPPFRDITNRSKSQKGFHPHGAFTDRPALVRGIAGLNPVITINSIAVEPLYRYYGGDATATTFPAWEYGSTLSIGGAGSPPTPGATTTLPAPKNLAIDYNAGQYHVAGDTSLGDLGNDDLLVEWVIEQSSSVVTCFQKALSAAPGYGAFSFSTGGTHRGFLRSTGTLNLDVTGLTTGNYYHFIMYADRNEGSTDGAAIFGNGTVGGTGNPVTVLNLDSAGALHIGADGMGSTQWNENVVYVAAYSQANWFPGGGSNQAAVQAVAQARYEQIFGV